MSDTTQADQTVVQSPPTAFGEYNFPSRDRIELFADDQLINVFWKGNIFLVSPGCFRVPRAMRWADFVTQVVGPWAGADPDFDASTINGWAKDDEVIDPQPDDTIESLGIDHKGLLSFTTAS